MKASPVAPAARQRLVDEAAPDGLRRGVGQAAGEAGRKVVAQEGPRALRIGEERAEQRVVGRGKTGHHGPPFPRAATGRAGARSPASPPGTGVIPPGPVHQDPKHVGVGTAAIPARFPEPRGRGQGRADGELALLRCLTARPVIRIGSGNAAVPGSRAGLPALSRAKSLQSAYVKFTRHPSRPLPFRFEFFDDLRGECPGVGDRLINPVEFIPVKLAETPAGVV